MPEPRDSLSPLSIGQKVRLLEVAREALNAHVRRGVRLQVTDGDTRLKERQGIFATLLLGDRVRGCIGVPDPRDSLLKSVIEVVSLAATDDPREAPLRLDEVGRVDIELSVLGPMRTTRPEDVEVGRHGLFIQRDGAAGVLLPQVAAQAGWSRTEFLDQVCIRAGLPPDAWRQSGARIEVFTADVFSETSLRRVD
ncbi:MAG: AmmeMemoRadiSam system protein A [Myxococcales bacterium]|nr:AmmeMemoRadiSam system protein A [Myxococcales bacterium]